MKKIGYVFIFCMTAVILFATIYEHRGVQHATILQNDGEIEKKVKTLINQRLKTYSYALIINGQRYTTDKDQWSQVEENEEIHFSYIQFKTIRLFGDRTLNQIKEIDNL